MLEKNAKIDPKRNVESIFDCFFTNMDHTMQFSYDIEPLAVSYDEKAYLKYVNVKKSIQTILGNAVKSNFAIDPSVTNDSLPLSETEKCAEDVIILLNNLRLTPWLNIERTETLYKSSLILILSYFDYMIADIIRFHFVHHPRDLPADSHITFYELHNCYDKADAINLIIDKKVDSLLSEGLKYVTSYFDKHLKINIGTNIINWDLIYEANERRNSIVHNNSVIDNHYFKKIKYIDVPSQFRLQMGESIKISKDYFDSVYNELILAGILISQNCWRKWEEKDTNEADFKLITIIDLITARKNNSLLERLYHFAKGLDIHYREQLDLNYCLCLKRQGKHTDLNSLISTLNSFPSPRLSVALSIIKDDFETLYNIFEKALRSKDVTDFDFRSWPILLEIQNNREVYDKLVEILNHVTGK